MDDWLTPSNVATVGFPIIVCLWLMRSGQNIISDNTKATTALTKAISELSAAISSQNTRLDHILDELSHVDNKLAHLTELFVEHKTKFERNDSNERH